MVGTCGQERLEAGREAPHEGQLGLAEDGVGICLLLADAFVLRRCTLSIRDVLRGTRPAHIPRLVIVKAIRAQLALTPDQLKSHVAYAPAVSGGDPAGAALREDEHRMRRKRRCSRSAQRYLNRVVAGQRREQRDRVVSVAVILHGLHCGELQSSHAHAQHANAHADASY